MHAFRDYVVAGGLMSYGPDFRVLFQRAAKLVDKILRGAMPENLPVGLPDPNEFELVINRTTAKALGLRDSFLTRSDEVADAVIG
jgi:putative ABC transport system substrate-binding protein